MDFSDAIQNRNLVAFNYDGHPRVVVPAAFGLHATTGNEVLRGYQVDGSGNSRPVPFWDLFLTEKMSKVEILDGQFIEDPPHYSRNDKHIDPIRAQL
ncbi:MULTISPECIES: hypothetical protein [Arthrobacter]|uniref:WYL domain-containing protein n=1 Tax=Arthrobacter terricola TaxID=2547396 RepID=A0A4R5K9T9_9MICC|nr:MULTISPECIES: hypothetical protein [Arthrobacter]MBT8163286.1 hypothetical protein [Arthrobacter sp. GN70]TDF91198.1 hypothetical protein E1809_21565 [Arthrobacter terricola]